MGRDDEDARDARDAKNVRDGRGDGWRASKLNPD